ncbi:Z1 domain-containing protein [Chitinophaga flava]|uniref:Endonuclease n=1 Tax=Chitinophaga flava TaxID=2259036 RepID=A0A365Y3Z4_9BACT|nr:Z1 domain-containing protein [Chitinophaga flava]RBL93303.1 endonuclease [Chitinophaga flava]
MSEILDKAKNICITILSNEKQVITAAVIKETIEKASLLYPLSDPEKQSLFKTLETLYAVFSDEYRILDDATPEPWVKNRKSEFRWQFWNRYRQFLESRNYAPDTINKLDALTEDILDRLVQPGSHQRFEKKGLIVGHVQSGKTSNYIGLICKAADVGYKLIIVLAGIHNSLRSQTQLRIDEGFLGFDTQTARNFSKTSNRIGVGRINPNLAAHSLTTSDVNGDFTRKASEASGVNIRGNDPIILVVKKNPSVLKNLLLWLTSRGETMSDGQKLIRDLPLLLIDDEADNASINISKTHVSKINAAIRALLERFEQNAYIGYTATPYANIFAKYYDDEEAKDLNENFGSLNIKIGRDIFPKDFIVNIPAPSNYIGPAKIFGIVSSEDLDKEVEPISLFRIIKDYQPSKPDPDDKEAIKDYNEKIESIRKTNPYFITDLHKKDDAFPRDLPPSLHRAMKCFFLACAARRVRGQAKEHNSMLIHVSRFIKWQDKIASLVFDTFKSYSRQIEFNTGSIYDDLKDLWEEEFVPETRKLIQNKAVDDPSITEISWSELKPHIYPAISKIDVRAVHGDTKIEGLKHKNIRPLDYFENKESGLSVIAIGGNKLSRGLTLEGLTISYYLRASKMYDTLMQMGRWFGYRPGYLDLCRLFTSEELVDWYRHVTVATEEMRAQFDRMCDLGKKPRDYGLKVRTHPGILNITAANKFRYKEIMRLSFSGELEETYSFKISSRKHQENLKALKSFVTKLGEVQGPVNQIEAFKKHFIWNGVANYNQIIEFLSGYYSFQPSFNVNLICEYILAQVRHGSLRDWTVALINKSTAQMGERFDLAPDLNVGLTTRTNSREDGQDFYVITKSHIIDPSHEYIDLTDEQISDAISITLKDWAKKGSINSKGLMHPSSLRIKTTRHTSKALLLVYLLNNRPDNKRSPIADCPVVGLAISFPYIDTNKDEKIEYAVNEQFLKEILDYPDELDQPDYLQDNIELQENTTDIDDEIRNHIEKSRSINSIIELSFKEGIQGNQIDENSIDQSNEQPDIIIPARLIENKQISIQSKLIPFIRKQDINKFYCTPKPDFYIGNITSVQNLEAGKIIAAEHKSGIVFSLSDFECVLEEGCIGIQSGEIPSLYLLTLLNSTLFSYWVAQNESNSIQVTIENFPIKMLPENKHINYFAEAIIFLGKQRSNRTNSIIINYFSGILNAVVFEIYFPEDFSRNNLSMLSVLEELILNNPIDINEIVVTYNALNDTRHKVHQTLQKLISVEKVKSIYNSLKN